MNVKRIIVIALIVVSVMLLAGWNCYSILNENPGNAVSTELAEGSAKRYLLEHHPGSGYEISSIDYDEKDRRYYVTIVLPGNADSEFSLGYDAIGRLTTNSYDFRVTRKANTAIRLSNEYAAAVERTLNAAELKSAGRLQWKPFDGSYDDPHCIFSDDLELNGVYDLSELGDQAGYLWVIVYVDSANLVTVEKLAESLLSVRQMMDKADLPFCKIDCILDYPNGTSSRRLEVEGFLYDEIYEKNMETRVEKALKE